MNQEDGPRPGRSMRPGWLNDGEGGRDGIEESSEEPLEGLAVVVVVDDDPRVLG